MWQSWKAKHSFTEPLRRLRKCLEGDWKATGFRVYQAVWQEQNEKNKTKLNKTTTHSFIHPFIKKCWLEICYMLWMLVSSSSVQNI